MRFSALSRAFSIAESRLRSGAFTIPVTPCAKRKYHAYSFSCGCVLI